ncbi:peptidoglycan-binding protein LysM [Parvularcula sp. LCG005]|uniref:peptidoglycan-binding protein LysM n=1 Tax=Parvularcula sp. LCG005 TaxID=3078805 RepID=UPI00294233B3|nr:peptidoglycan-binding protein LysM [Parvularcula sp. LCG005]WOI53340.1 peptidoglycan-binding protein LysM [Parvularcula sp. LCG005]
MGLFNFVKEAGARVADAMTPDSLFPTFEKAREKKPDTGNVTAEKNGDRVILKGKVKDREAEEKIVIAAGNHKGVSEVESQLEVEDDQADASTFYEVKSGDTLSKIAEDHYGNASKYLVIFEANQPMLEDPDKIYPGQVLRIPPLG